MTDGNGYHGLVEEGATIVNVTPAIKIEKIDEHELLCNIFILQDGARDDNSPFEVTTRACLGKQGGQSDQMLSLIHI